MHARYCTGTVLTRPSSTGILARIWLAWAEVPVGGVGDATGTGPRQARKPLREGYKNPKPRVNITRESALPLEAPTRKLHANAPPPRAQRWEGENETKTQAERLATPTSRVRQAVVIRGTARLAVRHLNIAGVSKLASCAIC